MPYWSIFRLWCRGAIVDALLECVPASQRGVPGFLLLFHRKPRAALACPYCNKPLGFDDNGDPQPPLSGWPVFRYGRAELEMKKLADGEPSATNLTDWSLRHRFVQPGTHQPFAEYTYAEDAPANETVP